MSLRDLRLLRAALLLARRGSVLVETHPRNVVYRKVWWEWPRFLKRWPWWLCPGSWDLGGRELQPFREQQMRELLQADGEYADTPTYAAMREELAARGYVAEPYLANREALDAYFQRQARILEDIRRNGLRAQEEIGGKRSHDITVRIDREGRLIKCREGTHRHAMALALELPRIPVAIDLAHMHWGVDAARRYPDDTLPRALARALTEYGPLRRFPWGAGTTHKPKR